MARKDEDPAVTDLARYRRARQRERARKPAPPPQARRPEPILGGRPRAGLILVIVILVLAALWILPGLR